MSDENSKKAKDSSKKSKKKPMTAYMLFFRDTYTAVKNTHPMASFSDVSKISAGMWDNLDEKTKSLYKQKASTETHNYDELLAVYKGDREPDDVSAKAALAQELYDGEDSDVLNNSSDGEDDVDGESSVAPKRRKSGDDMVDGDGQVDQSQIPNGRRQPCARSVCNKMAVRCRRWDGEYCSSICAITHCRDVFSQWVQLRLASEG